MFIHVLYTDSRVLGVFAFEVDMSVITGTHGQPF